MYQYLDFNKYVPDVNNFPYPTRSNFERAAEKEVVRRIDLGAVIYDTEKYKSSLIDDLVIKASHAYSAEMFRLADLFYADAFKELGVDYYTDYQKEQISQYAVEIVEAAGVYNFHGIYREMCILCKLIECFVPKREEPCR